MIYGALVGLLVQLGATQLVSPLQELISWKSRKSSELSLDGSAAADSHFVQPAALYEQTFLRQSGTSNACGENEAPQHSGYLQAGPDATYFYWLGESRSASPGNDPLILWMTGGPGCSSMLALLTENGPCMVQNGVLGTTSKNPWSWTEVANVLWVDQPAEVGFSFGVPAHDETAVGEHMYLFLRRFYEVYPKFLIVPFFIFGESFAGHYGPAVATTILAKQNLGGIGSLVGIGLGNALVDPYWQFKSKPSFAFTGGKGGSLGKGAVSWSVFQKMKQDLPSCLKGINLCQTDTSECIEAYIQCAEGEEMPISTSGLNPYDLRKPCSALQPVNCYNWSAEETFLSNPRILRMLGVPPTTRKWSMCNMNVNLGFALSGDFLKKTDAMIASLLSAGKRVLFYNGDADAMIDWIGSKLWLQHLQWEHRHVWSALTDSPYVVGNVVRGMQRSINGLTFLQIFDSGHLVPKDQPEVALAMVREFISPNSQWISRQSSLSFALTLGFLSFLKMWMLVIGGAVALSAFGVYQLRSRTSPAHSEACARGGGYMPLN